jgi:crotonobetainyl-CoA:carnitine CoA-transferase CaiB-like acyl-CoA transferase
VPCGVLNRIDQAVADEHVQARGFVVELRHSKVGAVKATGSPVRFSRTPVCLEWAGPLLGEHTREVLSGLGLSEAAIAELEASGVVRSASPAAAPAPEAS